MLQRSCALPELNAAQFAGSWSAPAAPSPLRWLLDGCVAELFTEDGSLWLSALSLRGEGARLEVGVGLDVSLSPIA